MRKDLKLGILVASIAVLGACSSTPNADNYQKVMNQPVVQNDGVNGDKAAKQLNKTAWNELKTANIVATRVDKAGNYAAGSAGGYLYVRANIVNEGEKPVQANWRCKFYDSNGIAIGDEQNNQRATEDLGLGWHTMLAYPVTAKSQTDEANLVRCIAPSKLATDFRVEVHDTSNDITVYK